MQILFVLVGIIGLGMTFFGIKMILGISSHKIISELRLTKDINEINFEQTGFYSVCVVGGLYVKNKGNFEAKVSTRGNELEVVERFAKMNFRHNGRIATEFFQFQVTIPGMHQLVFDGLEDIEVKSSRLPITKVFQRKLPVENIEILVKESSSASKFITAVLLMIFGVNIGLLGIILAVNISS